MLTLLILGIFLLGLGEFIERNKQYKKIEKKLNDLFNQKKYLLAIYNDEIYINKEVVLEIFEDAQSNGFFDVKLLLLKNKSDDKLTYNQFIIDKSEKTIVKLYSTIEYKNAKFNAIKRFAYVQFFFPLKQMNQPDDMNTSILVLKHSISSILDSKRIRRL